MVDDLPAGMKLAVDNTTDLAAEAEKEALIDFDDFLLMESSEEMEKQMLEDTFVLGRMAIMGQFTVFYGGPNAGKTLIGLKLLVEAIQSGAINGKDVFYINADDTYKGIVTKKRICEQYGFNMLVPGMQGFKADMLVEILRNRSVAGKAHGSIVILDTLKKFTDLMSKNASSAFGDVQRGFISGGGTIIGYAHVNKAKNDDGGSIHAGTTDIIDDGDCAYILDVVEDDGQIRTVKFHNIKDRGDVPQNVNYQYKSKGNDPSIPYLELFYSVTEIDYKQAKAAGERAAIAHRLAENHEFIKAVLEYIQSAKSEVVTGDLTNVLSERGLSKRKAAGVLDAHMGTDKALGHRWNTVKGEKNAKHFIAL
jgi:hypothetical protein